MSDRDRPTWLLIGGADSAAPGPWARDALAGDARVGTTNHGIEHCLALGIRPAAAWLSDDLAIRLWGEQVRRWQGEGTRLLTCWQAAAAMLAAGLVGDCVVPVDLAVQRYRPGAWSAPRFSGLMLAQWVLNGVPRPRRLLIAGFDGYLPHEEPFTGRIGPWWQSAADACPDVDLEFVTRPRYEVAGANVRMPAPPPAPARDPGRRHRRRLRRHGTAHRPMPAGPGSRGG